MNFTKKGTSKTIFPGDPGPGYVIDAFVINNVSPKKVGVTALGKHLVKYVIFYSNMIILLSGVGNGKQNFGYLRVG